MPAELPRPPVRGAVAVAAVGPTVREQPAVAAEWAPGREEGDTGTGREAVLAERNQTGSRVRAAAGAGLPTPAALRVAKARLPTPAALRMAGVSRDRCWGQAPEGHRRGQGPRCPHRAQRTTGHRGRRPANRRWSPVPKCRLVRPNPRTPPERPQDRPARSHRRFRWARRRLGRTTRGRRRSGHRSTGADPCLDRNRCQLQSQRHRWLHHRPPLAAWVGRRSSGRRLRRLNRERTPRPAHHPAHRLQGGPVTPEPAAGGR